MIKDLYVFLFLCLYVIFLEGGGGGGEGKHLSGNLFKSGLKHFTSEKDFAPKFAH